MDPIQALDMLSQVVKGGRLPYGEHVLLERSVDVLRTAITESLAASEDEEPEEIDRVIEETAKSKTPRRGERRKK